MAEQSGHLGAVVAMRPMSGRSVFDPDGPIDAASVGEFTSRLDDARAVTNVLVEQGFTITNFHPLAISFSGSPRQFHEVFGVTLHRSVKPAGRGRSVTVYTPDPEDVPRLLDVEHLFDGKAAGVAIVCPPRLVDDAGLPLRELNFGQGGDSLARCLPDELAASVWGDGLAKIDATGKGIVAALVGTGHYRHPFFAERRYRALPTLLGPGQRTSLEDEHGHSTGEAACLFAAAPNLRLRPIKGLLDPVGDMLTALASLPKPDLLINSWGYDVDHGSWDQLRADDLNLHNYLRLVELVIAHVTMQGVTVIAAAPRTWRSFPAAHPDVLSVGPAGRGCQLAQEDQTAEPSRLYPGQIVPAFLSRVGDAAPTAEPLDFALPTQPSSLLAKAGLVGQVDHHEAWARSDADQAAFPLAVGIIALLLERHRGLPPHALRVLLTKAATDLVQAGTSPIDFDERAKALAVNDDIATLAAS